MGQSVKALLQLAAILGAFATALFWAIPAGYQGKSIRYYVTARTRYPQRRGRLLRYRDGIGVGAVRGVVGAFEPLNLVGAGTKPAGIGLVLPSGVVEHVPPGVEPQLEILWTPEAAIVARV